MATIETIVSEAGEAGGAYNSGQNNVTNAFVFSICFYLSTFLLEASSISVGEKNSPHSKEDQLNYLMTEDRQREIIDMNYEGVESEILNALLSLAIQCVSSTPEHEYINLKLNRENVENPWFVFGISYAEALSVWFRLKFPHLTCGSVVSSGVVHAVLNFEQYDQLEYINLKLNRENVENPWFVFGISYAEALSVWFRLKFPHLTCGSVVSSGVVHAVLNFEQYDQLVQ
ncbi:Peptidase S28 [Artemisia annua]|uniref:Peptidase S28 n=1 Tax=Artemisia annua TaxID=35608 RepID=A0A2U1KBH3_ARTAN|nr:Peptidase S28 [Artemisia annua]